MPPSTPADDWARAAAEYATSLDLATVPDRVVHRARIVLLDTVGVCLRGGETEYVAAYATGGAGLCAGTPVGGPGATVFATLDRRPPVEAALVNAAGGTTLELDEGNQRSAHPGIHTVPPAIAVGEHLGVPGDALLAAIVAGYETGARLGDVIRPMRDGLHPHGGWAPVSGAVAAGRLLGLDVDELADAIRIAVNPFVVGHWRAALEGATVRDFYPGICCAHGVRAAELAAAGVDGVRAAVTECLLPYTAEAGAAADLPAAAASLGELYYLDSSYVKLHAACRYTHAPLEALAALLDGHDVAPAAVDRIVVETFALGTLLDERSPATVLAAKFSTPFALATRLVTGSSGVDAFTAETVADDRIRALAERVEVVEDDAFERRATEGEWGARVTLELEDGRTLDETVRDARGGGDDPVTDEEVIEKFDDLVGATLPADRTARLREALLEVEAAPSVDALLGPLRA